MKKLRFDQLRNGDWFTYKGLVYLKTSKTPISNAARIKTGLTKFFSRGLEVEKINSYNL